MNVSWLRIRTHLKSTECIAAVEHVTCIVPETAPVQKIQVLVVEILQGDFLLLLEAGKQSLSEHVWHNAVAISNAEKGGNIQSNDEDIEDTCNVRLCSELVFYLPWRSDVRVDDMVEVFMNSVQQPEEELLGIVLGVTLELKGAPRHHILQRDKHTALKVDCPETQMSL